MKRKVLLSVFQLHDSNRKQHMPYCQLNTPNQSYYRAHVSRISKSPLASELFRDSAAHRSDPLYPHLPTSQAQFGNIPQP
jgi:hypothetical protein